MKELPKKWCVMLDSLNYKTLFDWAEFTFKYTPENHKYITYEKCHGSGTLLHTYKIITFEDFKKLVLKEKTMKKSDFTIEGSEALKKAFVEESGLTDNYQTPWNTNLYLCQRWGKKGFDACGGKNPKHFILPSQWEEALEYVKEYFAEEEFKVGDWVITKNYCSEYNGKPLHIVKIENNQFYYFDNTIDGKKGPNFDIAHIVRLATPEEIQAAKTKSFKLGEFTALVTKDKVEIAGRGSLTHDECIELVEYVHNTVSIGGFDVNYFVNTVNIGCVKNIPFADMLPIYEYIKTL